ncbi:AbrB/MazE/SpoVT family DNA-binding domain-containing protein [Macrococcus lamae]|uniref:AbrB/MazE/SpoVT family DNA-binding domain-containing protein n=1 Tax=Macrococcus lamae TaxID=198484 RepID=A0A4R6BS61_9STAP|nr:AbrB/MazE/SpoVT family DNA-binding domain-containing protein [Macrococcus lamae]TDM05221.1 AbrB/MazE/SpoVT family DNA-binding domain-containing protein [Macrococcus lamae]
MSNYQYKTNNQSNHSIIKEQKLWKTGNSVVVTMPKEVLEHFNVSTGDSLTFIINEDKVEVVKKEYTDLDILKLVDRTMERHGEIIEGLKDR